MQHVAALYRERSSLQGETAYRPRTELRADGPQGCQNRVPAPATVFLGGFLHDFFASGDGTSCGDTEAFRVYSPRDAGWPCRYLVE